MTISLTSITALISASIVFGTVILFGATGEILTEKSGSLNLGVPGIMYMGGIAGLIGAFFYENACIAAGSVPSSLMCFVIALVCSLIMSVIGGLIYSFLTITLKANQNVTGLTLTIFGSGFANFFGGSLSTLAGGIGQISVATTSAAFRTTIPFLSGLGTIGSMFFSYGVLVYVAIMVAICLHYVLNRTRIGLNLRAIGENPATADAAGINVTLYKYVATCLGSAITGLGGLYFVMDYTKGTWSSDGSIEALGWLAVALVIFSKWKPLNTIWGAYVFGFLSWVYMYIPNLTRASQELFKMSPYVFTIFVLVAASIKKKRENDPPASLGLPYFREER